MLAKTTIISYFCLRLLLRHYLLPSSKLLSICSVYNVFNKLELTFQQLKLHGPLYLQILGLTLVLHRTTINRKISLTYKQTNIVFKRTNKLWTSKLHENIKSLPYRILGIKSLLIHLRLGLGQKCEWTKVRVKKYFAQIICLFPLLKILYDEWWGTRQ